MPLFDRNCPYEFNASIDCWHKSTSHFDVIAPSTVSTTQNAKLLPSPSLCHSLMLCHITRSQCLGECETLRRPTSITVYPKKYAHGFCFAVLCCGYTLTDFPISIRLTSLTLWQSNDCPSASKATLMNMDKYFMWIHYERLHNHNKAKHNKTVCIFLGIYCRLRRNRRSCRKWIWRDPP